MVKPVASWGSARSEEMSKPPGLKMPPLAEIVGDGGGCDVAPCGGAGCGIGAGGDEDVAAQALSTVECAGETGVEDGGAGVLRSGGGDGGAAGGESADEGGGRGAGGGGGGGEGGADGVRRRPEGAAGGGAAPDAAGAEEDVGGGAGVKAPGGVDFAGI